MQLGTLHEMVLLWAILLLPPIAAETCTMAGRFHLPDPTCRSYYLCTGTPGAFIQSNYTCPRATVFNPTSQKCSRNATCIDDACNGCPLWPAMPKIPDPNGGDCRTYIQCLGLFQRRPVVRRCDFGYFDADLSPRPGCWLAANCNKRIC